MSECNDPDHSAINAERQETRGLRRAWIELDDKRQYLEKQLREVTNQRDSLAKALQMYGLGYTDDELKQLTKAVSLMGELCPYQARREIKRRKALAATKGGSYE